MSIEHPDLPVKPPELHSVLARLSAEAGGAVELAREPEPLQGGFWAEMWTLEFQPNAALPKRAVLRIAPEAALAEVETAIHRAVAAQGFPTPAIIADGHDESGGRRWVLMEFASGEPLLAGLSGLHALVRLPAIARQLPATLAMVAADLHALDVGPVTTALASLADTRCGIDGLLASHAATAEVTGDHALAHVVARVVASRPKLGTPVICHGDLHPFNVLRTDDGTLNVLDWTAARVTDREYDIAFTAMLLSNPPLQAPKGVAPLIGAAARRLARTFVRDYERATSVTVDPRRFEWFTDLHGLRVLSEVAWWRHGGTLEEHRGHPWISIAPIIGRRYGL